MGILRDLFTFRKRAKTTALVTSIEQRRATEIAREVGPIVRFVRWCGRYIGFRSMAAAKRVRPRGPGATQVLHRTPNKRI